MGKIFYKISISMMILYVLAIFVFACGRRSGIQIITETDPRWKKGIFTFPSAGENWASPFLRKKNFYSTERMIVFQLNQHIIRTLFFISLPDLKLVWRWIIPENSTAYQVQSLDDTTFYMLTETGTLFCISPYEQRIVWRQDLECDCFILDKHQGYCASDRNFSCINLKDGSIRWSLLLPKGPVDLMSISEETVYCLTDEEIISVDILNKKVVDVFSLPPTIKRSPKLGLDMFNAIDGYKLLAIANRQKSTLNSSFIAVFREAPKEFLWSREDRRRIMPEGITGDNTRIFVALKKPTPDVQYADLLALSVLNGKTLWKTRLPGSTVYYASRADVICLPDLEEILTVPGKKLLYLIDPDTGRPRYAFDCTQYEKHTSTVKWQSYGSPNGILFAGINKAGTTLSIEYWHL
ncbi:MAG: PQQ-like beta-propeller repeat protein [bacterium]|nr:PQQ-like beta-propeller repeat protein [bacterium]